MAFQRHSGIYEPAAINLLQRVFDQLCSERRLARKDREQREHLAREVIGAFESGLTNETELWRELSKRRVATDP